MHVDALRGMTRLVGVSFGIVWRVMTTQKNSIVCFKGSSSIKGYAERQRVLVDLALGI